MAADTDRPDVTANPGPLSRPPSAGDKKIDRSFGLLTLGFTQATILLLVFLVIILGIRALPAIREYGADLLFSSGWDVNRQRFGIWPQIWGTLYTSLLALILGGFFGISIAIFLTENFLPRPLAVVLKNIVELLAAIPSVVYGLWGIYVLIPILQPTADFLHAHFAWFPLFSTPFSGFGIFPAALVLAIMILPTVAAISQDALRAVPQKTREAAFGMGATRWEAILRVILPSASGGVFGALVLGLGRALGETMALAMLVGNTATFSASIFSPASTLAALLALNFPEAQSELEVGVLMYAACTLLLITLLVNMLGAFIINTTRPAGEQR